MTTQLDVANLARAHLAIGRPIGAMNEGTQVANVMTQFYNQARDETLRDFNWPFARKYAALVQVAVSPTPDWGFSYRYPADCVAVRDVFVGSRRPLTTAARIPYVVGQDATGLLIYSSTASLQIEYTVAISESFWPVDFISAVSFLLAWYASASLTPGDPHKLGDRAKAAYQDVVQRAQEAGENEEEEELSVANMALSFLGVGRPMMSLTQRARASRAVHQYYDLARQEVFRARNWPFARKYASLTAVAGPSPRASTDFAYSYRYPADCLAARILRNGPRRNLAAGFVNGVSVFDAGLLPQLPVFPEARVSFIVGQDNTGRLIFTDAAPVAASGDWPAFPELEYTILVDESLWPPDFTIAVAKRLAWYVAPFVVEGDAQQLRERMRVEAQQAIKDAWTEHLQEQEPDPDPDSSFVNARY